MKIVVTGANGYIGSHLVRELLDNNHGVIAIDLHHDNIDKRALISDEDIFNQEKKSF